MPVNYCVFLRVGTGVTVMAADGVEEDGAGEVVGAVEEDGAVEEVGGAVVVVVDHHHHHRRPVHAQPQDSEELHDDENFHFYCCSRDSHASSNHAPTQFEKLFSKLVNTQ